MTRSSTTGRNDRRDRRRRDARGESLPGPLATVLTLLTVALTLYLLAYDAADRPGSCYATARFDVECR